MIDNFREIKNKYLKLAKKDINIFREIFIIHYNKYDPFSYFINTPNHNLDIRYNLKNCDFDLLFFINKKLTEVDFHTKNEKIIYFIIQKNITQECNLTDLDIKDAKRINFVFRTNILVNLFQIWVFKKKKSIKNVHIIMHNLYHLIQINSIYSFLLEFKNLSFLKLLKSKSTFVVQLSNSKIVSIFDEYSELISKQLFSSKQIKVDYNIILGKPDVFIYKFSSKSRKYIARIALHSESRDRLYIAKSVLNFIQKKIKPNYFLYPEIGGVIKNNSKTIFIETLINGEIVKLNKKSERQIVETLFKLHLSTMYQGSNIHLIKFLNECKFRLEHFLDKKHSNIFKNIYIHLMDIIKNKKIIYVLEHGDFKIENILYDKNKKMLAIIDWDLARIEGIPFLDLLFFNYYNQYLKNSENYSIMDFLFYMIDEKGFYNLFYHNPLYKKYTEKYKEFPDIHYLFLFWLHAVSFRYYSPILEQEQWREENINKPLKLFRNYYVS
jgi:serine/threonine protein kinase